MNTPKKRRCTALEARGCEMIKFDVLNKWTGKVQFTAEIDCDINTNLSWKLRLAIIWAIKNDANLSGADLRGADLSYAVLSNADLSYAVLSYADLSCAVLRGADLSYADLSYAVLRGVDLSNTDLSNAVLSNANLSGAAMIGTVLIGAENHNYMICPEQGSFQAWKKLSNGHVALLEIPARAKRITSMTSRKCRASLVKTIAIYDRSGAETNESIAGKHDGKTFYKKGRLTKPDKFDNDARIECSHGIHFFMTRQEAEDW